MDKSEEAAAEAMVLPSVKDSLRALCACSLGRQFDCVIDAETAEAAHKLKGCRGCSKVNTGAKVEGSTKIA